MAAKKWPNSRALRLILFFFLSSIEERKKKRIECRGDLHRGFLVSHGLSTSAIQPDQPKFLSRVRTNSTFPLQTSMLHLYSSHPLNSKVTTLTYETMIEPVDNDTYVTPSMLKEAVLGTIARKTEVRPKGFKNSFIVTLIMPSPRVDSKDRRISIKIFKNLRLHITGAHSLDMAQRVVDVVMEWLSSSLQIDLQENPLARQVDVVLYKYHLTGELNLTRVQSVLNDSGILNIYDPDNYAGVRAKLLIDDGKYASVMIFKKGKMIIIIPRQTSFDDSLDKVVTTMKSIMTNNWSYVAANSSDE